MDSRYLESTFNRAWKVCGRRLRPYSAAHLLALEAHSSPLCTGQPAARFGPLDLLLAVTVCRAAPRLTHGSFLPPTAAAPRLGARGFFWFLAMEIFPGLFRRQASRFLAYVADHAALPGKAREVVGPGGSYQAGGGLSGPYVLARVMAGMRIPGIGEARAWTMPLGLLYWYCDQHAELEGARLRFEDDSDEPEDDGLPPETIIRVPAQAFTGKN